MLFGDSLLLFMIGIYFLADHLQWVRMLKVGLALLSSGRRGFIQILWRKRTMNGAEG